MFPSRNPFNSDMDSYIRDLLAAGNPTYENTEQLTLDQDSDGETLTVTIDISTYNKNSVRIQTETRNNTSYLLLSVNAQNEYGMQSFRNRVSLQNMVDESSATAVENNGILTIKFDIVDSSNKEISIN